MEMLYIILAVGAVVYLGNSLTKVGNLTEKTVDTAITVTDTVNDLTVDTIGTYKHEVLLSNAEKRSQLLKQYDKIGEIVTINELDKVASGKRKAS